MGVAYTMCDFTSGPQTFWLKGGAAYAKHHDAGKVRGPEVFRGLVAAMRAGAGDDFVLMACTGPDLCGVGLYDAARACEDSEEGRSHAFDPQVGLGPHCRFALPLTRFIPDFADIFGASISEATMRRNPTLPYP